MFKFSVVKPSYEVKELIEVATRVACGELGICLPDNIYRIAPDPDGWIESRTNVAGWHDDRGVFVVITGRQPHEIARTLFHECSHFADFLRYGDDLGAAIADREGSEQRAQQFAADQTRDLPTYSRGILESLNHRLAMQKFPHAHAESLIRARAELASRELDQFDLYGEPD